MTDQPLKVLGAACLGRQKKASNNLVELDLVCGSEVCRCRISLGKCELGKCYYELGKCSWKGALLEQDLQASLLDELLESAVLALPAPTLHTHKERVNGLHYRRRCTQRDTQTQKYRESTNNTGKV